VGAHHPLPKITQGDSPDWLPRSQIGKDDAGATYKTEYPAEEPSPKPGGELREATITQAPHFSPFHPGADPSYVNFFRRVYGYYDYLWIFKDVDTADRMHLMLAASAEQPDATTVLVTCSRPRSTTDRRRPAAMSPPRTWRKRSSS